MKEQKESKFKISREVYLVETYSESMLILQYEYSTQHNSVITLITGNSQSKQIIYFMNIENLYK